MKKANVWTHAVVAVLALIGFKPASCLYIVTNTSIRIVSAVDDCSEGLIQIYNDGEWGSIAKCDAIGLSEYDYDWICNEMGFTYHNTLGDDHDSFLGTDEWLSEGGSEIISNFSFNNPNISYTDIDCDFLVNLDTICEDCEFQNKPEKCQDYDETTIIEDYFAFIRCDTAEFASWYHCQHTDDLSEWSKDNGNFTDCDDLQYNPSIDETDILLFSMVGAAVLLVCIFIIFQVYRRMKTTKRLKEKLAQEQREDAREKAEREKQKEEQKKQTNPNPVPKTIQQPQQPQPIQQHPQYQQQQYQPQYQPQQQMTMMQHQQQQYHQGQGYHQPQGGYPPQQQYHQPQQQYHPQQAYQQQPQQQSRPQKKMSQVEGGNGNGVTVNVTYS